MARCYNPEHNRYRRYGGRGISVCDHWHNVVNFYTDMHASHFEGASIERKDNDGDYTLSNCKWATNKEQSRNKSTTVLSPEAVEEAKYLYANTSLTQAQVGFILGGVDRECIKHVVKGLRK